MLSAFAEHNWYFQMGQGHDISTKASARGRPRQDREGEENMLELPEMQKRVPCHLDPEGVQMLLWQRKRPCLRPLADPSQLRGAVQQTAGRLFPQMCSPLPPWTLSSLSTDSAAVLPLWSVDTSYKEMLRCSLVLWSGVRCQTWLWRTLLLSYLPPGRVRTLPTHLGSEL